MLFIEKPCMLRSIIMTYLIFCASVSLVAQNGQSASNEANEVIIYFRFSKALIEKDYQRNQSRIY